MSTGSINLDILLDKIQIDAEAQTNYAVEEITKRYPSLTKKEALEIHSLVTASLNNKGKEPSLVITAPASFAISTKPTKLVVKTLIENAQSSILMTGYSLSGYFDDLIDCIIRKSQSGVFVKFFVNDIDNQANFNKLCSYKGRFLKVYNYPKQDDSMAALHAKVISVDGAESLITSANLSYHGQEGNIELGTHIESTKIAKEIDDIFTKLIFNKVFIEV